jgi:hypothetical protein
LSTEPDVAVKLCPDCGAENISLAKFCWMCRRRLVNVPTIVTAEVAAEPNSGKPAYAPSEWFFLVLTAILAGVLLMLGVGIAQVQPRALFWYAILFVPGFVATAVRVSNKRAEGKHVGWGEKLATFFVSTVVVIGVLAVSVIALVIAACALCFYIVSR